MSRRYAQHPRQVQRQQEDLDRELVSLWLTPAATPSEPRRGPATERPARYQGITSEADLLAAVGRDGLLHLQQMRRNT